MLGQDQLELTHQNTHSMTAPYDWYRSWNMI